MQSLIGIYIYWNYFIKKKDIKAKLTWLGLTIIFLAGLYFLYSKAVFVTLALWAMMFIFIRGRFVLLPVALVALLSLSLFTSNRVLNDINQVFSSETEYARGELESQYVLSGRVGIWKSYINLWKTLPVTDKLIGYGRSHGWFHNEYLRLLFSGGLLLLFAFLILATMIFVRVFRNFRRTGKATYFAALLCFALLFVESAGQLPGSYPDFQTFVWGIIGLSFNSISYADPFSNLITRRAEFYRLARG